MSTELPADPDLVPEGPIGVLRIHRGQLITIAVLGIVLAAIAIFWPSASLLTVAIIFGSYLVASGIFRITTAFVADRLPPAMRWLTGLMGLLVVVAGIICLADPFQSLVVLAWVIGVGWIAEGVIDIVAAVRRSIQPAWIGWVSGIVSIVAGIVTFVLPVLAVASFVIIAAFLLLAVSISTLLTLPRAKKAAV